MHEKTYALIQIELWDSKEFIEKNREVIKELLHDQPTPYSCFTSPSISEGVNYLITESDEMKGLLTTCIGATFDGNIGKTPFLWLRKEIMKAMDEK